MRKQKVPITMRALIQRINRKLAQDDEVLHAARSERARQDVGDYFVVDIRHGGINHKNVDVDALGRDLGVLRPWEEVK